MTGCVPRAAVLVLLGFAFGLAGGAARADDGPGRLLVLGPDGRPLSRVVVFETTARLEGRPTLDAGVSGREVALAGGVLEAAALAGTSPAAVVLWAPGSAATPWPVDATGVRLLPARALTGRIRFADDQPAAGRPVVAVPEVVGGVVHRTVTDEDGAYAFDRLAPGAWTLRVERTGGRWQTLGVFDAGAEAVDAVVARGGSVHGLVLDGDAGGTTPRPDVALRMVGRGDGDAGAREPIAFTTDGEGRFEVVEIPAGIWEVATPSGAAYHLAEPPPRIQITNDIRSEFPTFTVWGLGAVTGTVVDGAEAPVGGARVRLLLAAGQDVPPGMDLPAETRTDATGAFRVGDLRPGMRYRVAVAADGYAPTLIASFEARRALYTLAPIVLRRGWTLEVHTWAPGGVRLGGVDVRAVPATRPEPFRDAFGAYRTTTDAAGVGRIPNLPLDDLRVTAGGGRWQEVEGVATWPGSADTVVYSATLYAAPTLAGVVRPEDGRALPPLVVRALPFDGEAATQVPVAADGTFLIEGLRATPTDLLVLRTDATDLAPLAVYPRAMPGAGDPIEIPVPRPRAIAGTAPDLKPADGKASVRLEAPVRDAGTGEDHWRTVRNLPLSLEERVTRWRFDDLGPGPYAVRLVQGLRDSGPVPVWIDEEDVVGLELMLPAGARIAGTVLARDGRPALGAIVRLERLRGDGDQPGRPAAAPRQACDSQGGYAFGEVAPGLWRVVAADPPVTPDREVVRVEEGESLVLRDLVLGGGGAIEGRVYDPAGRALDGASLELEFLEDGAATRTFATREDGTFREASLLPGLYRLRLRSDAGAFEGAAALVEVVDGETTEVELTPDGRAEIEGVVRRAGRGVGDVPLRLLALDADTGEPVRELATRTDAAGAFAWRDLPAGRYALDVLDGVVRTRRRLRLEDADRALLDVELFDARIPGRVVSPRGHAVRDAWVRARPVRGVDAEIVAARVRTRPDGTFVLAGLPPGTYDLRASALGLPPGRYEGAVADDATVVEAIEIRLGRGGTLDLRVLDENGRGVPEANLWLENEEGLPLTARPYAPTGSGRLRLVGIPEGPWWLRVAARGYGTPPRRRIDIRDGAPTAAEVVLPPPARLLVVVRGEEAAVPPARVDLVWAADPTIGVQQRAVRLGGLSPSRGRLPRSGTLQIEDLGPGTYLLRVDAGARFETVERPLTIVEGEDHEVEIVLPYARR